MPLAILDGTGQASQLRPCIGKKYRLVRKFKNITDGTECQAVLGNWYEVIDVDYFYFIIKIESGVVEKIPSRCFSNA